MKKGGKSGVFNFDLMPGGRFCRGKLFRFILIKVRIILTSCKSVLYNRFLDPIYGFVYGFVCGFACGFGLFDYICPMITKKNNTKKSNGLKPSTLHESDVNLLTVNLLFTLIMLFSAFGLFYFAIDLYMFYDWFLAIEIFIVGLAAFTGALFNLNDLLTFNI